MSGSPAPLAAPQKYVAWINQHLGFNPRSQRQSAALSEFILSDWRQYSSHLDSHFTAGTIQDHVDTNISTLVVTRNVDLAIIDPNQNGPLRQARAVIEHKTIMAAHGRARKNRYGDIIAFANHVHNHNPSAIAAATVVINNSYDYINPDNLTARDRPAVGNFPKVVSDTVALFQSMPLRQSPAGPNDIPEALAIIVISYDGVHAAGLETAPPALQSGQPGEYGGFMARLDALYRHRYP